MSREWAVDVVTKIREGSMSVKDAMKTLAIIFKFSDPYVARVSKFLKSSGDMAVEDIVNEIARPHTPRQGANAPDWQGKKETDMTEREQVFKLVTRMREGAVTISDAAEEIASILGVNSREADTIAEVLEDSADLPTVEDVVNEIDDEFAFDAFDDEDEDDGFEDEDEYDDDDEDDE